MDTYKKKYNDMVQRARELHESGNTLTKKQMEIVCPELADSEDERIRKEIINYLDFAESHNLLRAADYEKKKGWIAWLEKQKEQNEESSKFELKTPEWVCRGWDDEYMINTVIGRYSLRAEVAKKRDDTHEYNLSKSMENWLRNVVKPLILEKQKEQKPVEWKDEYREEDIQTRFAFYTYKDDPSTLYLSNVFVEEASRNHGFGTRILKAAEKAAEAIGAITISLKVKQDSPANAWYRKRGYGYVAFEDGYDWLEKNLEYLKPKKEVEWSEEDRSMLNGILLHLNAPFRDMDESEKKAFLWLQNLPERFNLQPKQEWSEEDEKNLDLVTDCVYEFYPDPVMKYKLKDWLKALRPPQNGCKDCPHRGDMFLLTQGIKSGKHELASEFMNYLDENRPEGKMGLSNGECEDIDKAFKECDWAKIMRYIKKYQPRWKPSEEQMEALDIIVKYGDKESSHIKCLRELYEQLKKLM